MAKRPTSGQGKGSGRGQGPKDTRVSAALASREVSQILSASLDRAEEYRKEEYRLEAKRTRAESEMLAADLKRLVEKHGKDHPRVWKVQSVRAAIERQAALAEATVRRIDTFKPPARGGWTATGRVWNETGIPLADVRIEFVARENQPSGLEPAQTDAEGEFYATYPADIVRSLIEKGIELSLLVRKGKTVIHQEADFFRLEENAIRQFRVRLEKRLK